MQCNDCPNHTDSKCCHQSIKPKGVPMNTSDERAWQREFDRVEAKQNKSKTITFAGGHSYEVPENVYSNEIYQVKDSDNE